MMENFVKKFRKDCGMSQEQLSRESGVSRSTISEVETGTHMPTIEVVLRIAAALNARVEDLFSLSDEINVDLSTKQK